ncbi:unnamed protein product [Phytophthora lilii]|uniref:Unnamed protein product n=1 Tax=Phytophthora lilii TaxID=2077276 RepID=A0A9W6YKJ5_9STRA|nr:unnamed protein product [Phytophthora lilii]
MISLLNRCFTRIIICTKEDEALYDHLKDKIRGVEIHLNGSIPSIKEYDMETKRNQRPFVLRVVSDPLNTALLPFRISPTQDQAKMDPALQEEMARLQLSEPQLAKAKLQATKEEETAREEAAAVEEEAQLEFKLAEEAIQEAMDKAKLDLEKAEASVKRAQDKLKAAKDKSASDIRKAELKSWGKKKEAEVKQTEALMKVIAAATKTNDLERTYLDAQRRYQELINHEMSTRPAAVDKVVIETIPNPYL